MRRLDNFFVAKLKVEVETLEPRERERERERQACVARARSAPHDRSRHLEPTVGIVFEFPETALVPRSSCKYKTRRVAFDDAATGYGNGYIHTRELYVI